MHTLGCILLYTYNFDGLQGEKMSEDRKFFKTIFLKKF